MFSSTKPLCACVHQNRIQKTFFGEDIFVMIKLVPCFEVLKDLQKAIKVQFGDSFFSFGFKFILSALKLSGLAK